MFINDFYEFYTCIDDLVLVNVSYKDIKYKLLNLE